MKRPLLILVWLTLCIPTLQAQWLKKMTDKIKGKSEQAPTPTEETGQGDPLEIQQPRVAPQLTIGGDDSVQIDSTYEFDVAVYQESTAIIGNNEVVKEGGEEIIVYYSSSMPQFSIQMKSKATGARYYYYADFMHESQLTITAINHIGSGDKQKLDLDHMEPVFPGETGYISQLLRTGNKKVIAGVACEEYVAQNLRDDPRVNAQGTSRALITAHIWVPQEPHTLFHAYGLMPDKYKIQIEKMQIAGSYAPVVMPLEMYLEYSNGDKVFTTTSEIITGEPRKVDIADIIK